MVSSKPPSPKDARKARGDAGEQIAANHVRALGWSIIARNVAFRVGELDIVAVDGDGLVFVEVRSRLGTSGPRAADTVTLPKQRRLTRAANLFLARYRGPCQHARFDVIGVDLGSRRVARHVRGAFDAADF